MVSMNVYTVQTENKENVSITSRRHIEQQQQQK